MTTKHYRSSGIPQSDPRYFSAACEASSEDIDGSDDGEHWYHVLGGFCGIREAQ